MSRFDEDTKKVQFRTPSGKILDSVEIVTVNGIWDNVKQEYFESNVVGGCGNVNAQDVCDKLKIKSW